MVAAVAEIFGTSDLMRQFDALTSKYQAKVLRPALREGCEALLPIIQREAPKRSGKMAETFGITRGSSKQSRKGLISFRVESGTKGELGIPERTKENTPRGYYPVAIQYGWRMGRRALRRFRRRSVGVFAIGADGKRMRGPDGMLIRLSDAERFAKAMALRAAQNAEFGTKFHPADPFMSRAMEAGKGAVEAAVMAAATRQFERLFDKAADDLGVERGAA